MAKPTEKKLGKSFKERFIAELTSQCSGNDVAISNKNLKEALNWKDETFNRTRSSLIKDGVIKASPGPGGMTRFVKFNVSRHREATAFISYSHKDSMLKDEFIKHLHPLEKIGLIKNWHDSKIEPGLDIQKKIIETMSVSDIVFLLISIDFICSDFCYNIEMESALYNMKEKGIRVIPIILRSCLWQQTPFANLKALPKDGKSVTSYGDRDVAFAEIAEEVLKLLRNSSE